MNSSRSSLLVLVIVATAVVAFPGCTDLFPERNPSDTTTAYVPPIEVVDPGFKAQFGQACAPKTAISEDNCAAPDACRFLSQPLQVTMCTHECKTNAECAADARCTATPLGSVCVPLCKLDSDCQARISQLRCISLTEAEGVCWTTDANSGEVAAVADPVIERLELQRCTNGSCQPGLPGPGTDVQAMIYVGNTGIRDLAGLSATVIPDSGVIKNLTGSIGNIATLFGNSTAVLAVQPRFTIAAEVEPGTQVGFKLRLVSQTNDVWERPFTVTAFGSPATMFVNEVSLTENATVVQTVTAGATVSVVFSAANLGFGDAFQVSTTATLSNGNGDLAGGAPLVGDFPDTSKVGTPAVPQPVYQGTLNVSADAKAPLEIDVVMTDSTGASWDQTIVIPVKAP